MTGVVALCQLSWGNHMHSLNLWQDKGVSTEPPAKMAAAHFPVTVYTEGFHGLVNKHYFSTIIPNESILPHKPRL